MKRKIVEIDEAKCNGCGLCVPNCAEGALQIINGKAKLVKDIYCDGLGACLGHCPMGAIKIIERDAEAFDEKAVSERLKKAHTEPRVSAFSGCPGSRVMDLKKKKSEAETSTKTKLESELSQWPIQLMLVPAAAPYFKGADLLITADCVPFSYANFHQEFLKDKKLIICCPKLDNTDYYVEKLAEIFRVNNLKSITVLHMEVPCCYGLASVVKEALLKSKEDIKINSVVVGIDGNVR